MSQLNIDVSAASRVERIRYLMARLRQPHIGCPWDQKQTWETIAPFTIEEAYEVADAIANRDFDHIKEELGDLFFQVVFYTQMAEEEQRFQWDDVLAGLEEKLVRRHPHVFPDGTLESQVDPQAASERDEDSIRLSWDAIKQQEKREKREQVGQNASVDSMVGSILDGVPTSFSPLKKAQKIQSTVAKKGFDWKDPERVMDKLKEEIQELDEEVNPDPSIDRIADELGDLMFCCVNLARHYKLDAEWVMLKANHKFETRFRALEQALNNQGIDLDRASLEQMEAAWQYVKNDDGKNATD